MKALIAVLVAVILAGCSAQQVRVSDPETVKAALAMKPENLKAYILGPGDVVSVNVWRNPDLSISVPVRPDGKISTPLVGDIQAAGRTPTQLSQEMQKALAVYLREPQVSVVVTGMGSYEYLNRVRVTGAVNRPISTPYREGMTVLDLVLDAGNVNNFAESEQAVLYRQMGQKTVVIPVDLRAIVEDGNLASNYRLLPGDVLSVPERAF
ncbi:MAG: sugar ABC transporter substrate-binding protein [Gammaproteobacteria bacterium]|nr:MAG: sugar ABC transporter substrate-binding protein [Gammaproteobacteria bacterium]